MRERPSSFFSSFFPSVLFFLFLCSFAHSSVLAPNKVFKLGVFLNPIVEENRDFLVALDLALEDVSAAYSNFRIEIEMKYENSTYEVYNLVSTWAEAGFIGSVGPLSSDGCYTVYLSFPDFPVISPTATVPYGSPVFELSPPATLEITAVSQLMNYYSWDYFVVFYSDDQYGRIGSVEFGSIFRNKVKAMKLIKIKSSTIENDLLDAKAEGFRVFICFATPLASQTVLYSANALNMMTKGYAWIVGSGSSVEDTTSYSDNFTGLINIVPAPGKFAYYKDFKRRFRDRTGREIDHLYSSSFYDAVIIFAAAISKLIETPTINLTRYLATASFNTTRDDHYRFDHDNATRLWIRNFRNGDYQKVATWNSSMKQMIALPNLIFPGNTTDIPGRVVRIACAGLLSGNFKTLGQQWLNASKLAIKELNGERNNKPFLPSVRFELEIGDTKNTVVDTLEFLNQLRNKGVTPAAVCGSHNSVITEGAQITLSFYQIPQISPQATSDTLSNKQSYPYFIRGCAPDTRQVKTLVNLIQIYNWKKVGVVSGTDLYGMNAHRIFSEEAAKHGIEIVTVIPYNRAIDLDNLLDRFKDPPLKIFIILTLQTESENVLKEAASKGLVGPDFVWLGLDSVMNLRFNNWTLVPQGLFSVAPSDGDWYDQIGKELGLDDQSNHFVGHWFDSILFIGHSIKNLIESNTHTLSGPNLLQAMRNTSFTGVTGKFMVDSFYDRLQGSDIYNLQDGKWVRVYINDLGNITSRRPVRFFDGTTNAPRDTWTTWVDESSDAGVFVIALNSVGLFLWLIATSLVVYFRNDRVIQASSFEFLMLNSLGLLFGFITIFFFIGEPRSINCQLRYWFGCVGFVLVFGPLFTRTYRIYRLFQTVASTRIVVISNSTLYAYMLFMLLCPIILLIVWASQDPLEVDPGGPNRNRFFSTKRCYSKHQMSYMVILYVMGGVMLFAGGILSFLARNAATAFNESKWIGLSIYTLIVCALIAIPSSEALQDSPEIQVIILCSALIVGLVGILLFIFGSKIYPIINSKVKETDEFLLQ